MTERNIHRKKDSFKFRQFAGADFVGTVCCGDTKPVDPHFLEIIRQLINEGDEGGEPGRAQSFKLKGVLDECSIDPNQLTLNIKVAGGDKYRYLDGGNFKMTIKQDELSDLAIRPYPLDLVAIEDIADLFGERKGDVSIRN